MVWYNPLSWFSRSAQTVLAKANTSVLKNALRNYIKAVNSLKPNMRTNQAITKLLNQANVNANNKRVIKNRLANGVAKIVFASRPAIAQAANVVAKGAPEAPAAAAVNTVTNKIKNLNNFMAGYKGGNSNSLAKYYRNSKRNLDANRTINAGRGARYANLWTKLNEPRAQALIAQAAQQQPPAQPAAPAAVNNRFKNMNINALVNSAAQSMAMSNENKVKLKAAMNAKINTLNENSMNRVRLVNATRNLN